MARDPAHGGRITPKRQHEKEIILDRERKGQVPGPVIRDPDPTGDFIDATGQRWDIKGFASGWPQGEPTLRESLNSIMTELFEKGQNVILDTAQLSQRDSQTLFWAVHELALDGVLWWP